MISKGLLDKYGKVNTKTPADFAKTIQDVGYVTLPPSVGYVSWPGGGVRSEHSDDRCRYNVSCGQLLREWGGRYMSGVAVT